MPADTPETPETPRKRHRTEKPPLSAREIRFAQLCFEYGLRGRSKAFLEAGFPSKATPNDNESAACYLLRKPQLRQYMRQLEHDAMAAAAVSTEYLARGFKRAVDADVTRLLGPDGEMLPPSEWPEDVRLCVTRMEVEELSEMQPDPDNPRRKKKVAIGTKWKVWLENKTECRKVLAQWKRMIGQDKEDDRGKPDPLVVGGEANPGAL